MTKLADVQIAGVPYHSGVVTHDFDTAYRELATTFGVEWGLSTETEMPIAHDGEIRTVTFKMAYSKRGPFRIELVGSIADTIWQPVDRGVHHIGWWTDDVSAASDELAAQGLPLRVKIGVTDPDEPASFVMHEAADGMFVELVSSAMRPMMFPDD